MGTADIYRVVEELPEVDEALVIGAEQQNGDYWMPLFVALSDHADLDDALRERILGRIREAVSSRVVPDDVIASGGSRTPERARSSKSRSSASCRETTFPPSPKHGRSTTRPCWKPSPVTQPLVLRLTVAGLVTNRDRCVPVPGGLDLCPGHRALLASIYGWERPSPRSSFSNTPQLEVRRGYRHPAAGHSSPDPGDRVRRSLARHPRGRRADFPSGTFSPTTATLVTGPTEAVLIDAQYLKDDVRDLGDLIERTGKRLTTIYVTHAHADHYLGIGPLMERFPDAKCVALPHVVEAMKESMDLQREQWALMFGDACVVAGALPEPFRRHTLHCRRFTSPHPRGEAGRHPSHDIVHIPEIDVVVAGDSVYNEIHPMLGLSTPEEWQEWLETVDLVEKLNPRMIVAGHRRPDGDDHAVDSMIAETRAYLHDFAAAYEVADDAEALVRIMSAKYPGHGNLWTLQFSAMSAIQLRDAGSTAADIQP